jgi:hypothetical protein
MSSDWNCSLDLTLWKCLEIPETFYEGIHAIHVEPIPGSYGARSSRRDKRDLEVLEKIAL